MKTCRDCKEEKEESYFIKNKGFSTGVDTLCLKCNRKRVKLWRKENPEKRAMQQSKENTKEYTKAKHLRHTYGITLSFYNEMFQEQSGCCLICKKHQSEFKRRLSVDHDHKTGKIRGLLCYHCNHLLGNAKDDIKILQSAISYLTEKPTGY